MARGYQNYHGKRSGRRLLLVALLVLVVLLCAGYLVLQNYIVYESDGSVTLDLPFLQRDAAPSDLPGDEGEELPIEIIRPQGDSPHQAQEAPAGTEGPFSVAEEALYDLCRAEDPGPAPGCQGLVAEVKGENGTFYYQSDWAVEGAADTRAVSRSSVAERLSGAREWNAVAAIHCLRDDFYPMADMEGAGICQSTGYIWFGVDNAHYLDPSKPGARAYLCGVAEECRDMGFDEVLLRGLGYPTRGNLNKIDYSAMELSKEEALEALLRDLREALGEGALLSVELTAQQVLSGGDSGAGIDLARVLPLVDRLYIAGQGDRAELEAAVAPLLDGDLPAGFLVLEDGGTPAS